MDIKPFTFDFAGKNSRDDFGIYAVSYDLFNPVKREKRQKISFRHGTYTRDKSYYDDRALTLRCFWMNDKVKNFTRTDIREITLWLSTRGQITLDVEPDKYYIGELYDHHTLEVSYNKLIDSMYTTDGSFDLMFVCDPFAYGEQNTVILSSYMTPIEYKGTAESPTLIVIRNPNNFAVSNIVITSVNRIRA